MDGQKKFPTGIQITAVIFVIVIFAALYYLTKRSPENQPQQQPTNEQQVATSTPAATSTTKSGSIKKSTTPSKAEETITYEQALKTYAGKTIQFDPNCATIPAFATYLNNTRVMFDNRYEKGRWFYLDGKGYYLSPYGFKIVTLYGKTLPHTIMIDCGTGKNNGQILLQ